MSTTTPIPSSNEAAAIKADLALLGLADEAETTPIQPDANGEFPTPSDGAKFMASLGIPQVPLSAPTDTRLSHPGKNPAINGKNWQQKASADFAQIDRWAVRFPGCNFGSLAKLQLDGFYVLETDSKDLSEKYKRKAGREFRSQLVIESSATDRNHRWYRHSKVSVEEARNIPQEDDRGFSLRCDNEQAVSPGSIHANGKQYRVVYYSASGPALQPVEELRWLNAQKPRSAPPTTEPSHEKTLIRPGGHHAALLTELGHLVRRGYSKEAACQALQLWAQEWFETPGHGEPLKDHIRKMVDSANGWERGNPRADHSSAETITEEPTQKDSAELLPVSGTADQVVPKKIVWLWPNRIAQKLNMLVGNPDKGKGLITHYITACVTTGRDWFDGKNTLPPSEVLILSGEEDWDDTIVPRLISAGADLSKVRWLKMSAKSKDATAERELQLDRDAAALESFLAEHPDIRLVVVDPISNYLGSARMIDEQKVRADVLTPLKEIANRKHVAIIGVMHLNKKVELDAIHRIGGAMAFVGVARMVWLCAPKSIEDGTESDDLLMVKVKGNIVHRNLKGLSYRTKVHHVPIEGEPVAIPYVEWIGEVDQDANELIGKPQKPAHRPAEQLPACVDWLRDYLKDGPVPLEGIESDGKALHGFSPKTIQRARESAGVVTFASGKTKAHDGKMRNKYSCRLSDRDMAQRTEEEQASL